MLFSVQLAHESCLLVFRLEEIGAAAAKEYSLEKALEKMKFEWKDVCFEMIPYRETVCSASVFLMQKDYISHIPYKRGFIFFLFLHKKYVVDTH